MGPVDVESQLSISIIQIPLLHVLNSNALLTVSIFYCTILSPYLSMGGGVGVRSSCAGVGGGCWRPAGFGLFCSSSSRRAARWAWP